MSDLKETSSKRPRHGLVALTEKPEVPPESRQHLVVGECVRSDAAERSGLLSGVVNTDGLAALPVTICPEDVQLWQAACVLVGQPSTDELVTIIRVADALGDSKVAAWTDLLGKRAAYTNWKDSTAADAMACSLLSLPHHLLTPVFRRFTSSCPLRKWDLFTACPASLHGALLSAEKSDVLAVPARPPAILEALAATTFDVPRFTRVYFPHPAGSAQHPPQISAPLLARALAAHRSLTHLHLTSALQPQWLTKFATCLPPSLANLSHLEMNVEAHPGACAAIARCLKRLPCLCCLDVGVHITKDQQQHSPSLSMLQRAAACPAALTCLTALTVCLHSNPDTASDTDSAESNLLQLLPLLHAPALASLTLASWEAEVSVSQLWFAMRHLTAITHLCLEAEVQPPPFGLRPDDQKPPPLQSMDVRSSQLRVLAASFDAVFPTISAGLTRLCFSAPTLGSSNSAHRAEDPHRLATDALLFGLFNTLCGSCALRSLALDVLYSGMPEYSSIKLAQALSKLTALTELSLQSEFKAGASDQRAPVLFSMYAGRMLPQLQSLQRLRLCGMTAAPLFDAPAEFLQACSQLCALEQLEIRCRDISFEQICHAVVALPCLKSLTVLEGVYDSCEQDPETLMSDLAIDVELDVDTDMVFPDDWPESE